MTPKLRRRNLLAALVGAALISGLAALPTASAQSGCDSLGGTVDAMIFYFGEDQVVSDNAGPHQIAVPRSELAPLLA
jgi:hypothetical protein